MKSITNELREVVRSYLSEEYPREGCGLLVEIGDDLLYVPCRNIAEDDMQFIMHPRDFALAENEGVVRALVHSHPNGSPLPSQADRAACRVSNLPWYIVSVPSFAEYWLQPADCMPEVPYLERQFAYGAQDCYTLVCDWYRRELGITLPDRKQYADEWEWWKKGKDFINYEFWSAAGFAEVSEPVRGDLIIMRLKSAVANHVAVYVGDSRILHQRVNFLSMQEMYDDFYRAATMWVMRHRKLG